jgi:gliding motility-associated-like protein
LNISNNFGCESKATKSFCINNPKRLFVPNSFSPNGDGLNDEFSVVATGVQKIKMRIYNRWQQLIFEETSANPIWNAKTLDGDWIMQGVYTYWIEVTWEDGSTFIKAGTLHRL